MKANNLISKAWFKSVSILMVGIFCFQQVAWTADLRDLIREEQDEMKPLMQSLEESTEAQQRQNEILEQQNSIVPPTEASKETQNDLSPIEQEFEEAFQALASLDINSSITLTDAKNMRTQQAVLKSLIESLPEAERAEWITRFNEYLTTSDRIIASKELKVVLSNGLEVIVRNPTQLMMDIIGRFKMMDQTGEIDLTRLAGIDGEDVQSLDTFGEYVKARQIGLSLDMPIFNLYSPLGNLELIDRIVRKYPLSHVEGPAQVLDNNDILRYVDGTKQAFDKAMQAVNEIFANNRVNVPSGYLTIEKIYAVLNELTELNNELGQGISEILNGFSGEQVFKNILKDQIMSAVMYGIDDQRPSYISIWNSVNRALSELDVVYVINNREIKVTKAELDNFASRLPYDFVTLFKYPGIKRDVDPSFMGGLISKIWYDSLGNIVIRDIAPDGPQNVPAIEIYFSYPAQRLQLLEILLNTWKDEVINTDGTVNFDRLRMKMLISPEMEKELNWAAKYLEEKVEEMKLFGRDGVINPADYLAMKELLSKVQDKLKKHFSPFLADVIYDVINEVTIRVNGRFQELVKAFSNVLAMVNIEVVVSNGQRVVFDPRQINKEILDRILSATSVRDWDGFYRGAYLRLNSITDTMINALLSPSQLDALKNFSFSEGYTWQQPFIANEEILFELIPQIVKQIGTANSAALTAYLIKGITLPVELGKSLVDEFKNTVQRFCSDAIQAMSNIAITTIDGLAALINTFNALHDNLKSALAVFHFDKLLGEEISQLQNWFSWGWYDTTYQTVSNYFHNRVNSIEFLYVKGVKVPVSQIMNIPGFPWSEDYDSELFVGISPKDFTGTETWDDANRYLTFNLVGEESYWPNAGLTNTGRIQLAVNILSRLIDAYNTVDSSSNPYEELAKIFFRNNAGTLEVDPEALRKYIKGVYAMQKDIIEEAGRQVGELKRILEEARKGAYTVEEIRTLYNKILGLRAALIAYMEGKANKHERQDVITTENQVSLIYQECFDKFVEIVGAADLIVSINGQNIVVPAKVITERIIAYLRSITDSIAAHTFAKLYGVDVGMLRNLHKLENYLNDQVVCLPRNSEYIQIVSQISELGYMELAVELVKKYQDEVIINGKVDIDLLIALLTNKEVAVAKVKNEADKLYYDARGKLEALIGNIGALNINNLEEMLAIIEDVKAELVSKMNDFLSGKDDNGLKADLETYVRSLHGKLKELRDSLWKNHPIVINIEGMGAVTMYLNEQTFGRFVNFIGWYLASHSTQNIGLIGFDYEKIDWMSTDAKELATIWNPIRSYFNGSDHLTEFGLAVLFVRLAAKFGEFIVVNENGQNSLSMDKFISELQKTDEDRALRRLEILQTKTLAELRAFIDSLRDQDGALSISKIPQITKRFLEIKNKIISIASQFAKLGRPEPIFFGGMEYMLGYATKEAMVGTMIKDVYSTRKFGPTYDNEISQKASQVWATFVELYESSLFKGILSLQVNGRRVTFDAAVLEKILMELDTQGKIALALDKDMIEKGESVWQYDDFKNLIIPTAYSSLYDGKTGDLGIKEEEKNQVSIPYSFTLTDLLGISAIKESDLAGLDVIEKDILHLSIIDPEKLMGLLDIRALAPGSGVSIGGLMKAMNTSNAMMSERVMLIDLIEDKVEEVIQDSSYNLSITSIRFRVLELIPSIIRQIGSLILTKEGKVDADKFCRILEKGVKNGVDRSSEMRRPTVRPVSPLTVKPAQQKSEKRAETLSVIPQTSTKDEDVSQLKENRTKGAEIKRADFEKAKTVEKKIDLLKQDMGSYDSELRRRLLDDFLGFLLR